MTFVVDRWLGQTDARQVIFIREPRKTDTVELRLYLIDHGMSFAGKQWELPDSPRYGLYMDRSVYSVLEMTAVCEETLSRIDALTETDLYATAHHVPGCWFTDNDYEALAKLFVLLERRRRRLRSVISRNLRTLEAECSPNFAQPSPMLLNETQQTAKLVFAPAHARTSFDPKMRCIGTSITRDWVRPNE